MSNIQSLITTCKDRSYKMEKLASIMNYRRTHGFRDGFALIPTKIDDYEGRSVWTIRRYKTVLRQLNNAHSFKPKGLDSVGKKSFLNDIYDYSINPSDIHKYNRFVRSLKRSQNNEKIYYK